MAVTNNNEVSGWTGWVYFAGFLMILAGISQAFLGLTALLNHNYLLVTSSQLIVATSSATTWGWIHLGLGVLILAAGFSVMHGSRWARVLAVLFAGASFLGNLAFIGVFPVWAIVAMVVDVLVLYALVVHGNELA